MIGVESWSPCSSGVTTNGTIGIFAYFWYSAIESEFRTIQRWGTSLKRKKERIFTENGESSLPKMRYSSDDMGGLSFSSTGTIADGSRRCHRRRVSLGVSSRQSRGTDSGSTSIQSVCA